MRAFMAAAVCVGMAACGGEDEVATTCSLGQLEGAWIVEYTETEGTCGPISTEVVVDGDITSSCVVMTDERSSDLCSMALRFECPTEDNLGSTEWSVAVAQDGVQINGMATVKLSHVSGTCQSTYQVQMRRLQ